MKKTIEIKLNVNDDFFKTLKNGLENFEQLDTFYKTPEKISNMISSTLKTLKNEVKSKFDSSKLVKISFEEKEHTYLHFHNLLEHNIDLSLDRRIHSTTLERVSTFIEDFMVEYADMQADRNKIKATPLVNEDNELKSITDYIMSTWNGFDKFDGPAFFKQIWDKSNTLLINNYDQYAFTQFVESLYAMDKNLSVLVNKEFKSDKLGMGLLLATSRLHDAVQDNWDYAKNVKGILSDIKKDFPLASKAKPKGWLALAKDYPDRDGMDELDEKKISSLFNGMDSGTATSFPFEVRTSLSHVMHDDREQGRKSLEVLVGAIVAHVYVMKENNNSSKMLQEWIEFKSKLEKPGIKELNFDFKEPLNLALLDMIRNQYEVKPSTLSILNNLDNKDNKKKKIKP